MDELILAALQKSIAPADAERLHAWRQASPRNEAYYRDVAQVWALTAYADPFVERAPAAPTPAVVRARMARGARHLHATSGQPVDKIASLRRAVGVAPRWVRSALATAAAAAAVMLLFMPAAQDDENVLDGTDALSAAEFVTDTSEMATARLGDGSVVRLAPASRLRVQPTRGRREVWLDGEAFFAVAPDSTRPFTIRTRNGEVEVLGTRFDLRVVGSELRLVVTDGKVALTTSAGRRIVVAGQMASVSTGVPVVQPIVRADSLLGWMGGFLAFQDTPLRQVAIEIENRYGVRVLLPDSAMASRTVTAWFTGQDLDHVLAVICTAVGAHCTLRDGVVSIEP